MNERVHKALSLLYGMDGTWRPLPFWPQFFISLGAALGGQRATARRIVVAVSVPTASFASAFVALGRVLAEPLSEPASAAVEEHFAKLTSLPDRAPLMYFNGEVLYRGPFLGTAQIHGEDYIRIGTGRVRHFVPKHRCLQVELVPEGDHTTPNGTEGGRLRGPKPFVHHFYSRLEHYNLCRSSVKCVTIIGAVNRLRAELIQASLAVRQDQGCAEGVLQDLIRVGKFAAGGLGCRASVYAASKGRPLQSEAEPASLVVFDGALSSLRWAHQFVRNDCVTILDRTDPAFGEGVDAANIRYLTRLDDCTLPGLGAPPAGVDLMAHVEARQ